MKKLESKLQKKIRHDIEEEFVVGFWFKTHGSMFQKKGLPDLLGCVWGLYLGLEVKTDKGSTDDIQDQVLKDIRKAGGLGTTVRSSEEAIRKIYRHLERYYGPDVKKRIRRLANKRSRLRLLRKKSGFIHATWNWENHSVFNCVSKGS